MLQKFAIIISVAMQAVAPASADDGFIYYFCPKSAAQLSGNEYGLSGRGITPFPKEFGVRPGGPKGSSIFSFSFSDCSNSEFVCMDAQVRAEGPLFRIFSPRKIESPNIYKYGDARALAMGVPGNPKRAQLVIWQEIEAEDVALKLTIEEGKGIVFIDGINFWHREEFTEGETCILESNAGYFPEVKVKPAPLGKPLY